MTPSGGGIPRGIELLGVADGLPAAARTAPLGDRRRPFGGHELMISLLVY